MSGRLRLGPSAAVPLSAALLSVALGLFYLTGEFWHEVLGTLFAFAALWHVAACRGVLRILFKGNVSAQTRLQQTTDLLLTAAALTAVITGFGISRFVTPELRVTDGLGWLTELHLLSAHWTLAAVMLHAGARSRRLAILLEKTHTVTSRLILFTVLLYGARTAADLGFFACLALQNTYVDFDAERSPLLLITDWFAVSALFCWLTAELRRLLRRSSST